jgi:hypothetical protein
MGEVYEAFDAELRQCVAVKTLRSAGQLDSHQRALARVSGPHQQRWDKLGIESSGRRAGGTEALRVSGEPAR